MIAPAGFGKVGGFGSSKPDVPKLSKGWGKVKMASKMALGAKSGGLFAAMSAAKIANTEAKTNDQ